MQNRKKDVGIVKIKQFDWQLMAAVLILSVFGIIMLYSASSYSALRETGDSLFYVKKQVISFVVAVAAMFCFSIMKLQYLNRYKFIILIVSYILLALVFVPVIGIENYGAKRWINLGFTTLQPSELAKFCLVIFLAGYMSKKGISNFKTLFPALLAGGIMCILIIIEPNMSITMCVGGVLIVMLLAGGLKLKHFIILAIPVLVLIPVLIIIEPYRLARLLAFVDPWASPQGEGYQLIQSYYAIGSGGFFGVGLFQSRQKYLFLPFAESDFIFSIVCEELGLMGGAFVIIMFVWLIMRGIKIAMNATNRFESYLATGITAVIAIQTFLNMAVVTGMIPPTGLPLPFVSNGGTSLVAFMSATGILQAIHRNSHMQLAYHSM